MSAGTAPRQRRPERPRTQEVRGRLEHERETRLAQLTAAREGMEVEPAREQTYAIQQVLKEIDKALSRLVEGRYGVCQGCERDIPAARLEILPYAARCVACQVRVR